MRFQHYLIIIFLIADSISLFAQGISDKKLFTSLPSSYTGVTFRNEIHETNNFFYFNYEYLYNGAGVAIGDINNDGLQDIYFCSTTNYNKLYLNEGNLKFRDITDEAGANGGMGIKTGANMIDINGDGWMDIVVSKSGPFDVQYRLKVIYINNGNLTFTDRSAEYGLDDASHTTQTYFLDYDKDGDMDAFMVNHSIDYANNMVINAKMENGKIVMIDDTVRKFVSLLLFENKNGRYVDVSTKAGISTHTFGLGAVIGDVNQDGWPDIYVANDFKKPDYLYINNKDGTFSDKLTAYFQHISQFSMGLDYTDINNDGLEDFFILDMAFEDPARQKRLFTQHLNYDKFQTGINLGLFYQYSHNTLQINNGDGTFSDAAYYAGVAETDWSWGPIIADFDNDGWKDIYVANGYRRDVNDWDYRTFFMDSVKNLIAAGHPVDMLKWFSGIPSVKIKNYFYRNNGTLKFDNYTDKWSDAEPSFSNGAAYADLDNDGDIDIVVNNAMDEAFILKNNLHDIQPTNYIRFQFYKSRESKQEVYGTIVKLYDSKNNIQLQHYDPQRGFMSSSEHFLHFGLGKESLIPKIEITFPSGKQIILNNTQAGQVVLIYESDATSFAVNPSKKALLFSETTDQKKFSYTHRENDYIDFKREPLIPYKCSRKGPYYAKADINGDGLEDLFIGGSAGSEGTIMIQTTSGVFTKKTQSAFLKDKAFEDAGAVFFDADGDSDLDLYVVSGGSQFAAGSILYQDRLYINDGKGNFVRSLTALPKEMNNGSYVIAADIDGDGDLDLFVGGAVTPGKFPTHDNNMLLQNNKGVFKNVTDLIAPELNSTGLVNYAAWGDIDGDNKNELLLSGEWMPIMIFKWNNNKLEKTNNTVSIRDNKNKTTVNTSLNDITGWWSTIKLADIDNDGDLDIIAGNRGENSKITASFTEPCMVYAKDFDGNGSYDALLGYYIYGKCYPMYHRDQLIDQMPFMRKKYYRYRLYADKTMDELFTDDQKKGMDVYKTNCFESGVFVNEGNNQFRFVPLPEMAQLSNINDFIVEDVDADGHLDLIAVGNSSDPDVGTGNYDARASLYLKGKGDGSFSSILNTGLSTSGEVRKIISIENGKSFILLKNNAPAQVFSINKAIE